MWQMVKQVIKSFKKSFVLIFSLVFITFCIIFSSFSLMYLNTTTTSSLNQLKHYGNSASVVAEKDFKKSNVQYIVEKKDVNTPKDPVLKNTTVSNFQYVQGGVIFPYDPTDFSNPLLNEPSNYWMRKKGIARAAGAKVNKIDGSHTPNKINNTDYRKWYALGWKMSNGTKEIFNPENIIYGQDEKGNTILSGYYDPENHVIKEEMLFFEGIYKPNSNTFSKYQVNVLQKSNELSHIIDNEVSKLLKTSLIDWNLMSVYARSDLYYALIDNVTTKQEKYYTITLDLNSLTTIQKNILDKIGEFNPSIKEKILKREILLKDNWINKNNKKTPLEILESIANQESMKLDEWFNKIIDDNAYKFFENKNLLVDENDSFSITDSNSAFKYLVSKKDDTNINKIVYQNGSKLQNSENDYLEYASKLNDTKVGVDNNKYLRNYVEFLSKALVTTGTEMPKYYVDLATKILNDLDNGRQVNLNEYNHLMAIYQPVPYKNGFVQTDEQRIDVNIYYRFGVANLENINVASLITPYGYAAIVPQKFLDVNNKTFLPNSEWKNALNLKPNEFMKWINLLDSKYTININTTKFVIIGTGISPEMAYPSTSLENLIINPENEMLVYVNKHGYDSILATLPTVYQNRTLVINDKNNSNINKQYIDNLNKEYTDLFNPGYYKKLVYDSEDFFKTQSILAFRSYLPDQIKYIVSIFALVFIIVLIIIGLYLSYLLLNSYITKNIVQLSIIRANGTSTFKMCLSLSVFGLFIAILGGFGGYIAALFLQPTFFSAISTFWFIPINFLPFSALGFFGGFISLFVVFFIFAYIILYFRFKKPINELVNMNTEMKISKALYIFRSNRKFPILAKFRMQLTFASFWRFVFYTFLCSVGISSITLGLTVPNKFNEASILTNENKKYTYSFQLVTPNEQSGLYKRQKYSELGFTDSKNGIYPLYLSKEVNNEFYDYDPKFRKDYPYFVEELKVYDENGQPKKYPDGRQMYFANMILPSLNASEGIIRHINFGRNLVFSKWLLDFNLSIIGLNPWEYIKESLPPEIIAKAETQDQIFLEAIVNYKKDDPNSYIQQSLKKYNFIIKKGNKWCLNDQAVVSISNLIPEQIKFKKEFLDFIGHVYGIEELSNKDVKFSYGIIPYNENTEEYTYIDATTNLNKKNVDIKINGIKPNSKYITLYDENKNYLNDLLTNNKYENPLIINSGAAYKYDLKVGDKIKIKVNNSYFRHSKKVLIRENMLNQSVNNTGIGLDEYTMTVVGIATTSYGEEFYTSQSIANNITGMVLNINEPTNGGRININYTTEHNKEYHDKNTNFWFKVTNNYVDNTELSRIYTPFNGLYTNEENPFYLTSNISFYSPSGVWANLPVFTEKNIDYFNREIRDWQTRWERDDPKAGSWWINQTKLMTTYLVSNNPYLLDQTQHKNLTDRLLIKLPDNKSLKDYFTDIYGKNNMLVAINSIDPFLMQNQIYNNVFTSLDIVQKIGLSIFIPLVIVMILVLTTIMMSDFKNMIAILKTLGYSDKENIMSILITYVPIFILATIVGVFVSIVFVFLAQSLVYGVSSIFISTSIPITSVIFGILSIFAIMLLNFMFTIILLKNMKLKNVISQ